MAYFKILLEAEVEGGYVVSCPALPGCYSQGDTKKEAIKNIREAILGVLEVLNDRAKMPVGKNVQTLRVKL